MYYFLLLCAWSARIFIAHYFNAYVMRNFMISGKLHILLGWMIILYLEMEPDILTYVYWLPKHLVHDLLIFYL